MSFFSISTILNSIVNTIFRGRDIYDHLMRTRIFTLMMNMMVIYIHGKLQNHQESGWGLCLGLLAISYSPRRSGLSEESYDLKPIYLTQTSMLDSSNGTWKKSSNSSPRHYTWYCIYLPLRFRVTHCYLLYSQSYMFIKWHVNFLQSPNNQFDLHWQNMRNILNKHRIA